MSTPDPNIRISNAEREAVIARLHAATEQGRLGLHEFEERSREAYEAKTYADVERLLADLPGEDRAVAIPKRPKGPVADELVLDPTYTKAERKGVWTVPSRIVVKPKYGRVRLDFRHARFTTDDVDLHLELEYAPLVVILPRNATAVDEGVRLNGGGVKISAGNGGGPTLHLTGRTVFARAVIRYERRFLWWRW